jgi:hypothetical protein
MLCGGIRKGSVVASAARRDVVMRRRGLGLAVFAVVCAGCSGGDAAAPSSTAAIASTTTAASVEPPSTIASSVAPTTLPTTSPPAATSGTDPPTSTTAVLTEQQAEQEVIEAAIASWTAFNEAKLDPTNDDLVAELGETRTGPALDRAVELIVGLRAQNRRSRTHPTLPATVQGLAGTARVDLGSGTASVEYCWLNSNILVETVGDGTEEVIDASVSTSRDRDHFELRGGRWLKTSGEVIETHEGVVSCSGNE